MIFRLLLSLNIRRLGSREPACRKLQASAQHLLSLIPHLHKKSGSHPPHPIPFSFLMTRMGVGSHTAGGKRVNRPQPEESINT